MSADVWMKQQRYALLEHTVAKLKANQIDAEIVADTKNLIERLEQIVPDHAVMASGGSVTLEQTGVLRWLSNGRRTYYSGDPHSVNHGTGAQVQFCDYYFMSSNAITMNGQLYNVDGTGNRVSALAYGPAHVIVIAGANKIVRDITEAEQRVKMVAAPCNAVRLNAQTGCAKTGFCVNCKSEKRLCCQALITSFQRVPDRIRVFLLPDTYGF